jgi:hypothetical protein
MVSTSYGPLLPALPARLAGASNLSAANAGLAGVVVLLGERGRSGDAAGEAAESGPLRRRAQLRSVVAWMPHPQNAGAEAETCLRRL